MTEIWLPITGYDGKYEISSFGRVRSNSIKKRGALLKTSLRSGYPRVTLCAGSQKTCRNVHVHRLVAEHFIPNPDNLPMVNHLNLDRADNRVTNLEWTTCALNLQHARDNGRIMNPPSGAAHHLARAVVCIETGVVYPTLAAAGKAHKTPYTNIQSVVNGKSRTAAGYTWRYY